MSVVAIYASILASSTVALISSAGGLEGMVVINYCSPTGSLGSVATGFYSALPSSFCWPAGLFLFFFFPIKIFVLVFKLNIYKYTLFYFLFYLECQTNFLYFALL